MARKVQLAQGEGWLDRFKLIQHHILLCYVSCFTRWKMQMHTMQRCGKDIVTSTNLLWCVWFNCKHAFKKKKKNRLKNLRFHGQLHHVSMCTKGRKKSNLVHLNWTMLNKGGRNQNFVVKDTDLTRRMCKFHRAAGCITSLVRKEHECDSRSEVQVSHLPVEGQG